MAVEEPPFKLVLKAAAFEVRDYPALTVAEVTVDGEQTEAAGKGFRLLAGYIFGGNAPRRGAVTTAPTAQPRGGEKIAMTAPVSQLQSGGGWIVRFTMPSAYRLDTLPAPNNPKVRLQALPPARMAVLRFSGVARRDAVAAKTAELSALAKAHDLRIVGPVALAQYDPPWTPWFMRRNEVMAPVEP